METLLGSARDLGDLAAPSSEFIRPYHRNAGQCKHDEIEGSEISLATLKMHWI